MTGNCKLWTSEHLKAKMFGCSDQQQSKAGNVFPSLNALIVLEPLCTAEVANIHIYYVEVQIFG